MKSIGKVLILALASAGMVGSGFAAWTVETEYTSTTWEQEVTPEVDGTIVIGGGEMLNVTAVGSTSLSFNANSVEIGSVTYNVKHNNEVEYVDKTVDLKASVVIPTTNTAFGSYVSIPQVQIIPAATWLASATNGYEHTFSFEWAWNVNKTGADRKSPADYISGLDITDAQKTEWVENANAALSQAVAFKFEAIEATNAAINAALTNVTATDVKINNESQSALPTSIEKGKSLSFKLTPDNHYALSNPTVTHNGTPVEADQGGVYTIAAVQGPVAIIATATAPTAILADVNDSPITVNNTTTLTVVDDVEGSAVYLPSEYTLVNKSENFAAVVSYNEETGVFTGAIAGTVTFKVNVTAFNLTSDTISLTVEEVPATMYTITFDKGHPDATGTMQAAEVEEGQDYPLPANGFTAPTHKHFKAWSVDNVEKQPGDNIENVTSDKTVTALWEDTKFTVTFDSNGGSAVESQKVVEGSYVTKPENPTLENNVFVDWYTEVELENKFVFDTTPITEDITLFAKWELEKHTVSFNTDGGTEVANQSISYGGHATRPAQDPTKDHFSFVNWYVSQEANAALFDFENTVIVEDTIVYAKWNQLTVTVSFNLNYETQDTIDNIVVNDGAKIQSMPAPTRDHYTLVGWFTQNGTTGWGTQVTTDTVIEGENRTLYAQWEIDTHTVTYKANGGTGDDYVVNNRPYNSSYQLVSLEATGITAPENGNFAGWKIGEEIKQPTQNITIAGDTEIKATWTAVDGYYLVGNEAFSNDFGQWTALGGIKMGPATNTNDNNAESLNVQVPSGAAIKAAQSENGSIANDKWFSAADEAYEYHLPENVSRTGDGSGGYNLTFTTGGTYNFFLSKNGTLYVSVAQPPVTTYTVTQTLSHCESNFTGNSVNQNASFNAVITPEDNYEFKNVSDVTVTMGNQAVENAVEINNNTAEVTINGVSGNIVVEANPRLHGTTDLNPLTIDEAYAKALLVTTNNANDGIEYYVKGIVNSIQTAYSQTNGNISLDLKTSENQTFRLYRLTVTSSEASQIEIGTEVLAKGYITKYNTTYELASGGALISIDNSKTTSFTIDSTLALSVDEVKQLTVNRHPSTSTDGITFVSNDTDVATVDSEGRVTGKSVGTTTVTASIGSLNAQCAVTVTNLKIAAYTLSGSAQTWTANSTNAPQGTSVSITTNGQAGGSGLQMSGNTTKTTTMTISGYAGKTVSGIILSMRSNQSSGSGSFTVSIGGETVFQSGANAGFNSSSWNGAWTTSYVPIERTFEETVVGENDTIVITIIADSNSLYINGFSIIYS